MPTATLQLPVMGFLVSKAPCSECCEIVVRESQRLIYAGHQTLCYDCNNPLNVIRVARDEVGGEARDARATDLIYERDSIPRTKSHDVVEVSFDRRLHPGNSMQKWLERFKLEGFVQKQARLDWVTFRSEKATPEACVVVMLDEGVVGRCLSQSK